MLQEGREVRSRAKVADVYLFALNGRRVGAAMLIAAERLDVPLEKNRTGHGIGNGASNVTNKFLERRHSRGGEIRTGDGHIDIEVGDRVVESTGLLLDPFGGTDEAFFFSVPTAEDDGAARPPALVNESTEATNGFKHGGGTAGRINCAIDPRIAVIAEDDRCAGILRALDFPDDIPDDAALVVLLGDEVDFYAAGAEVIAERQCALPGLRNPRPCEGLENGCGIVEAERNRDDARLDAIGTGDIGGASRVRQIERGSDAGSFGIAGIPENVIHRAALDASVGTPGTDGIGVALVKAVVLRIGV